MISTLGNISPDAPLRLATAAKLAFPDGSMTVSGLRREAARGRLRIERIAGKDFTTLDDIKLMRELCRVPARAQSSQISPTSPSVTSTSVAAISPQNALRGRLKQSRVKEQSKL
jgi:hypothetical protein